mgnify:CR=1 FL=1
MELSKELCKQKIQCRDTKKRLHFERSRIGKKLRSQELKQMLSSKLFGKNVQRVLEFLAKKHKNAFLAFIGNRLTSA